MNKCLNEEDGIKDELFEILFKYQHFLFTQGVSSFVIDLDDFIFLYEKAMKAQHLQQVIDRYKKSCLQGK